MIKLQCSIFTKLIVIYKYTVSIVNMHIKVANCIIHVRNVMYILSRQQADELKHNLM